MLPPNERRESVTACLIVRDEAARLPEALASVAFCDEIVVVDGGSSDETVSIARAAGARVVERPWPGYGAQRNVAIDHARSEWVLEVDADERVSPALRAEIERFLLQPPASIDMGALPIRNIFLGRPIAPAARYPAYRFRLFRRTAYRHDERRTVHEGLWSNGPVWPFTGDLIHVLADSLREALTDTVHYARLDAQQVTIRRTPLALASGFVGRPVAKFFYRSIVLAGWRDGWRGLLKIGLDCVTDALVAVQVATKPRHADAPAVDVLQDAPAKWLRGSVRIVAVAVGRELEPATTWLETAAAAGADVAAISDAVTATAVRVRRLPRASIFHLIRTLDAENQLRPYDALLVSGPKARRLVRFVPRRLRGRVAAIEIDDAPASAVRELFARTRPGGSLDLVNATHV